MKNSRKIMLRIVPIVLVLMVVLTTSVFASSPVSPNITVSGTVSNALGGTVGNVWQTVLMIIQIVAVAAVIFAGVKYMFAGADSKADIKKQMLYLVIGAVLVFGASTVINLIITATTQIIT